MLHKFSGVRPDLRWDIIIICGTWVNQLVDPEIKQQTAIRAFPSAYIASFMTFPAAYHVVKLKGLWSVCEQMVASLFGKAGQFATVPPLNMRTVDVNCFVHFCLPQVFESWRRASTDRRDVFVDPCCVSTTHVQVLLQQLRIFFSWMSYSWFIVQLVLQGPDVWTANKAKARYPPIPICRLVSLVLDSHAWLVSLLLNSESLVFVFRSGKSIISSTMRCKWPHELDVGWLRFLSAARRRSSAALQVLLILTFSPRFSFLRQLGTSEKLPTEG